MGLREADPGDKMTAREIMKQMRKAGWHLVRVTGSHHIFKHPEKPTVEISVPFHRKDLPPGLASKILKQAGLK